MLDTYEQNSKKKLIATIVTVVVIAGIVVVADMLKNKSSIADVASQQTAQAVTPATDQAVTSTQTTNSADTSSSTATSTSSSAIKDGTYSATADYYVPHGTESIKVNVTLSGGTITDVSIANSESDHDSAEYQAEFSSSYKSYVVGKKISGLQLSNVAGASDTTEGFNEALDKIAAEAQA